MQKHRELLLTAIHQRKAEDLEALFSSEDVNPNFIINHMQNTPLHIVAAMDVPETMDMVKVCIKAGADVDCRDVHGRSAIHFVAGTDNVALIRYLIKDVNADINCVTEGGETPLIKAIGFGKANIVSELLELGADVTIKTFNNESAIDLAAKSLNKRIVQIFEEYKAMISAEGEFESGPGASQEEKPQILTQSDPEADEMMD
ncbi:unnamed protein product [Moneuplotes crassus]|uniref:Ankyrin repeat domain-containing protein 54 n=1 Tax=Euplotes crassus TaxID=5936 RepID=A0AAD1XXD8_EUPCR|nr:unnamed protein product [Moneuplotes crassus]